MPPGARLVNRRVWFRDRCGVRSIYCQQTLLYRYPVADARQRRLRAAQLVEEQVVTFSEACRAFGIAERTFCRVLKKLRQGGRRALAPAKTGPKSRRTPTVNLTADIVRSYRAGGSTHAIAAQLGLSPSTVARVLKERGIRLRRDRRRSRKRGEITRAVRTRDFRDRAAPRPE